MYVHKINIWMMQSSTSINTSYYMFIMNNVTSLPYVQVIRDTRAYGDDGMTNFSLRLFLAAGY